MKQEVVVGTAHAQLGAKSFGVIKVGELADSTPLEIPVIVTCGNSAGPTLYVQAACHGEELNGVEVIRRVVTELDSQKLSGTIIAVPVANVLAFNLKQTYTPLDWENMNRTFPGRPDGNISEQMANAIWGNCIEGKAHYVIDFHTGIRTMLTYIFVEYGEDEVSRKSEELAKVFGTELLVKEVHDEHWRRARFGGKLRNVCNEHGIPSVTPELDGRRHLDEAAIQVGVRGFRNVMKHLGMIEGKPELPQRQIVVKWGPGNPRIIARHGGLFIPSVKLGQEVSKGAVVGKIYDVRTFREVETLTSPIEGIVYALPEYPMIGIGDQTVTVGEVLS